MMNILPIKFISEFDQPIFGVNFFNLAKLQRNGFPVAQGVVVAAPEMVLKTVLEHLDFTQKEVFEQRLVIVKNRLAKVPCPVELGGALGKERSFYLNGRNLKKKERVWQELLNLWYEEVRAKFWRSGFNTGMTINLTPQAIFFVSNGFTTASAYFDQNINGVVIKAVNLHPSVLKEIDEMVLAANKKLFFSQIYSFLVIRKEVQLVGASPFTQTLAVSPTSDIIIPKTKQQKLVKSAVKIFFNLSQGFTIPANLDGVLIEGEKSGDFESTVFKVAEAALSFPGRPVIFRLPDVADGDVQGTLRLIHQKSLLDRSVEAFLFVRNKKSLLNVELGIPSARTPDELVQIKQKLSARGVNRKGVLKFWLEMVVPENLLNLEDYLAVGIDGVILNLDRLQFYLGGYEVIEGEFYRKQVVALVKFIQPAFKVLYKARVSILAKGELCIHPDILDCLIENGVWGIVANTEIEAESLPEHLNWSERRMVAKRFA